MTLVVIPPGTETQPNVEQRLPEGAKGVVGTTNDDRFRGTVFDDIMSGLPGDGFVADGDYYILVINRNDAAGDVGNYSIQSNRGNDSIIGGLGDDCIRGGKDNDVLEGNEGADLLYGDRGEDIVSGGGDSDTVLGGQGNDSIDGGSGNDSLRGGKGNDIVLGGTGDDVLSGDKGNDVLTGGEGADIFFFLWSPSGSYGTDTLTEFNSAEDNVIGLSGRDFGIENKNNASEKFSTEHFFAKYHQKCIQSNPIYLDKSIHAQSVFPLFNSKQKLTAKNSVLSRHKAFKTLVLRD